MYLNFFRGLKMKVSEKIIQYLDDVERKILDGFAVNNNSLQDVRDIRRNIQAIINKFLLLLIF